MRNEELVVLSGGCAQTNCNEVQIPGGCLSQTCTYYLIDTYRSVKIVGSNPNLACVDPIPCTISTPICLYVWRYHEDYCDGIPLSTHTTCGPLE